MMPPSPPRRPLHRRLGCGGWLLFIAGLLALLYSVMLLISPWAVHIGGSATPLLTWDGYGEGVTPAGTHVLVAVSLGPFLNRGRGVCFSCGNLSGSGELCTANADIHFKSLGGNLHAWWTTEGSSMTMELYKASGVGSGFELDLHGTWHGNGFDATDQSILFEHLTPDGHFHLSYTSTGQSNETSVRINKGGHDAFAAACKRLATA